MNVRKVAAVKQGRNTVRSRPAGTERWRREPSTDHSHEDGADTVDASPSRTKIADLAITGASPRTCGSSNTSHVPSPALLDVDSTGGIIVSAP
jgi:hypothetical protein